MSWVFSYLIVLGSSMSRSFANLTQRVAFNQTLIERKINAIQVSRETNFWLTSLRGLRKSSWINKTTSRDNLTPKLKKDFQINYSVEMLCERVASHETKEHFLLETFSHFHLNKDWKKDCFNEWFMCPHNYSWSHSRCKMYRKIPSDNRLK